MFRVYSKKRATNSSKTTGANTPDIKKQALHKKIKFSLRISSVDVTKSAENSGFGHAEEILNGKPHLLCS